MLRDDRRRCRYCDHERDTQPSNNDLTPSEALPIQRAWITWHDECRALYWQRVEGGAPQFGDGHWTIPLQKHVEEVLAQIHIAMILEDYDRTLYKDEP
jgi:hypothetical protein